MKRVQNILLFATLLFSLTGQAFARDMVVLVASDKSSLNMLGALELRKIYLGFKVKNPRGKAIKALVNASDEKLEHIFFQYVVAMSEKSFRRRMLSLMVRKGIPRPQQFKYLHGLHQSLIANPDSVSFMWIEDAQKLEGLKTIRLLWKED